MHYDSLVKYIHVHLCLSASAFSLLSKATGKVSQYALIVRGIYTCSLSHAWAKGNFANFLLYCMHIWKVQRDKESRNRKPKYRNFHYVGNVYTVCTSGKSPKMCTKFITVSLSWCGWKVALHPPAMITFN